MRFSNDEITSHIVHFNWILFNTVILFNHPMWTYRDESMITLKLCSHYVNIYKNVQRRDIYELMILHDCCVFHHTFNVSDIIWFSPKKKERLYFVIVFSIIPIDGLTLTQMTQLRKATGGRGGGQWIWGQQGWYGTMVIIFYMYSIWNTVEIECQWSFEQFAKDRLRKYILD